LGLLVFLFGEAEKGPYGKPIRFSHLEELPDLLGEPPGESLGIGYAIQTLLTGHELLYFRVHDEGLSWPDYQAGLRWISTSSEPIAALALPGVGDEHLLEKAGEICATKRAILMVSEGDLYDLLTSQRQQ
jgi:hypothetical protein